ncbi:MAG: hypothetical protein ACE5EL_03500, partial [Anaerolineae bacterium]
WDAPRQARVGADRVRDDRSKETRALRATAGAAMDPAVTEPGAVHWLLYDPRAGWLWLVLRAWLGWKWLAAAQGRIADPDWIATGAAVKELWEKVVAVPEVGRPGVASDWYRWFLERMLEAGAYRWLGPIIAYGELLVGIALVAGAFTAVAAALGALMNWSLVMSGSASTNPVLLGVAIGLILAWRVAGHVGFDYFLLPALGARWRIRRQGG